MYAESIVKNSSIFKILNENSYLFVGRTFLTSIYVNINSLDKLNSPYINDLIIKKINLFYENKLFNYSDNLGGAARASYRIHKSLINQGIKSNLYVSKKSIPDISIQESPNKFDRYFSNLRPQLVSKFIKLMNPKINSYSSIYLFCAKLA